MATVAEQLKSARAAQRLSAHRVAEVTHMRIEHVQAIEAGDYDAFAAPVYLHGFVRAYARFVRLDEQALLAQLDQEIEPTAKASEPPALPATGEDRLGAWVEGLRRFRWRTAAPILGGVLLAWGGYSVLRSWTGSAGPAGDDSPAPGLYPATRATGGDVLPLPAPPRLVE